MEKLLIDSLCHLSQKYDMNRFTGDFKITIKKSLKRHQDCIYTREKFPDSINLGYSDSWMFTLKPFFDLTVYT